MNGDMDLPNVHTFAHVVERARDKAASRKPHAALVVPSSSEWLTAAARAISEGWLDLTLVGDEPLVRKIAAENHVDLDPARFIDINEPDKAIVTAAQMAKAGEIDLIVKGRGDTVAFLRLLLSKEAAFVPKGGVLSHVAVMKPERYAKLLMLSDAAVVAQPNLTAKLALIENMSRFAAALGITNARIAVVTAVEAIYPNMPATTDGAILAKMSERGQIKGCVVDGPLSFDIAVDLSAAHAKGIRDSRVAGQADGLIAPSIETANGIYKSMALFGRADTGGLLCGGRVPVALGNRWDSVDARFHSIALAAATIG